jgi:hypothetical protein
MAVVLDPRMPTLRLEGALEPAFRCASAARLGRLQYCAAARATYLLEDGLQTAGTRALVTDLLTVVRAALQQPVADTDADMLSLEVLLALQLILAFGHLSFLRLLLARTAPLATLMTAAVERGLADTEADRLGDIALVTDGLARGPPAAASDVGLLHARLARTGMAEIIALVAAGEGFAADLIAVWYRVLTGPPWFDEKRLQRRFAAGAAGDDVGGERAVRRRLILWVAVLVALVITAVERPFARCVTSKAALKPL